jgi:hypothetical protein
MWWFARPREPPLGLPTTDYAVFAKKDGWYFVRSWPDLGREWYRQGPFPEKDDARYWAWKDAEEKHVVARWDPT